ncbi:WhiB family transcriptional regulator [Streptomyces longispororuber]|uniref:WhiB family transcriptional regulator n=1 Tax=Streptomyces longispororuber TaxID=68230 RepID=UPI003F558429
MGHRTGPVRTACLAHALDHRIEHGVRGGTTECERRAPAATSAGHVLAPPARSRTIGTGPPRPTRWSRVLWSHQVTLPGPGPSHGAACLPSGGRRKRRGRPGPGSGVETGAPRLWPCCCYTAERP